MATIPRRTRKLFTLFISLSLITMASIVSAANLAIDNTRGLAFSALTSGVMVLDINDTTNITLVSDSIQTGGVVKGLFYDENTQSLFIAADEGGLEIWDVQNPAAPDSLSVTKLYYFNYEAPAISVAVVGATAHVSASGGYFHSLDVTDLSNPQPISINASFGNPSGEVELASDGRLYLASPTTGQFELDSSGVFVSADSNQYSSSSKVFGDNNYVYAAQNSSLHIMDANAGGLPFLTNFQIDGPISDIFAAGAYLYIAGGNSGLRIFDVSSLPAVPELIVENSDYAFDVRVDGNFAYVRGSLSFRVVDVSDPSNPDVVGTFDVSTGGVGNIEPIATANSGLSLVAYSGDRVTIVGSGYDIDGTVEAYSWVQISGPSILGKKVKTNIANLNFKAPRVKKGFIRYGFELTVTDDDGATGTDEVILTVLK